MKTIATILFGWMLLSANLDKVLASDGDDHDDHDDADELCSEFNVTDAATCQDWCGEGVNAEYTYLTEHGDWEDLHLDYLKAWECHCESNDGADQHCFIPYQLPKCETAGLADCGANATMTCGELCLQVGLGNENSTTVSRRSLGHVTDTHFCAHSEHDHGRALADKDHGDDDHQEVTICYCNADQENAKDSTVACSHADLEDHDHGSAAATKGICAIMFVTAAAMMMGLVAIV